MNSNSTGSVRPAFMDPWMQGGISQITPILFLSGWNMASNTCLLQFQGITCMVNAAFELPSFSWPFMEWIKVPLVNMPQSPIYQYFDRIANKIHSVGRMGGKVLVYDMAGVSRSASLCLAYLMKYHNMTLVEAHTRVKARRPVIRPNNGFWRQLIAYERKLFGMTTVKLVRTPNGLMPRPCLGM